VGTVPEELLLARDRKEKAARIEGDAALGERLDEAISDFEERFEKLEAKTRALLKGRDVDSRALISTIQRVVTGPGFALAEEIKRLEAMVTDGLTTSQAYIEEISRVIATTEYALAEKITHLHAQITTAGGLSEADVMTILTAYATKTFAEAKKTEAITASYGYTDASISTEQLARANADSAISSSVSTLDAQVNHATTGLPNAHARITSEETARATADTAISTSVTTLDAQVNNATTGLPNAHARITSEETARTNADSAISSSVSTLDAQVNHATTGLPNAHARITSEQTARANADSAITSNVNTLSAQVNDPTTGLPAAHSAVTTEASARANADGSIHAHWGIRLDANGRVIGRINLNGTNGTSTLDFDAGTIRMWNGSSAVAPFVLEGGVVTMQNVVVKSSLDVGSGENRTQINNTGLKVGYVTIDGLNIQNSINIGSGLFYPVYLTGGNANAALRLGVAGQTGTLNLSYGAGLIESGHGNLYNNSNGRWELGSYGTKSIVLTTNGSERWVVGGSDGHLKTMGNYNIQKATSDGWSVPLWDGSNSLEFRWDGGLQVRVDFSSVYTITTS
jgi:hypothetical protein